MRTVLYYVTLPVFYLIFILMQLFEGFLWLVQYPYTAWLYIKETLGIGQKK